MIQLNQTKLEEIAVFHKITLIVLFGSTASGESSKDSDIDLGILFETAPTNKKEERVLEDFIHLLRTNRLDIAVLNHASPLLLFQVATKGKLVYEKNKGNFLRFSITAYKKYWESNKFRKLKEVFLEKEIRRLCAGSP
ncbi:nucleotidyltransferase domain-containing protein [bacterium]|nr:nucleotidyltransferase domain-containing protein [bacterium]